MFPFFSPWKRLLNIRFFDIFRGERVWRRNIDLKWVKHIWQISRTVVDIYFWMYSEVVVQWCSVKKVFLEICQNSEKNNSARVSFLIKLLARPATLLKKRLWHRCFPVNFCEISKNTFFHRIPLVAASEYTTTPQFPRQFANQVFKRTSFTYDTQMFVSTITHDFCRQSITDPRWHKTQTEPRPKRKINLFPEMWVTRKNFTWAAAMFFLINLIELFK